MLTQLEGDHSDRWWLLPSLQGLSARIQDHSAFKSQEANGTLLPGLVKQPSPRVAAALISLFSSTPLCYGQAPAALPQHLPQSPAKLQAYEPARGAQPKRKRAAAMLPQPVLAGNRAVAAATTATTVQTTDDAALFRLSGTSATAPQGNFSTPTANTLPRGEGCCHIASGSALQHGHTKAMGGSVTAVKYAHRGAISYLHERLDRVRRRKACRAAAMAAAIAPAIRTLPALSGAAAAAFLPLPTPPAGGHSGSNASLFGSSNADCGSSSSGNDVAATGSLGVHHDVEDATNEQDQGSLQQGTDRVAPVGSHATVGGQSGMRAQAGISGSVPATMVSDPKVDMPLIAPPSSGHSPAQDEPSRVQDCAGVNPALITVVLPGRHVQPPSLLTRRAGDLVHLHTRPQQHALPGGNLLGSGLGAPVAAPAIAKHSVAAEVNGTPAEFVAKRARPPQVPAPPDAPCLAVGTATLPLVILHVNSLHDGAGGPPSDPVSGGLTCPHLQHAACVNEEEAACDLPLPNLQIITGKADDCDHPLAPDSAGSGAAAMKVVLSPSISNCDLPSLAAHCDGGPGITRQRPTGGPDRLVPAPLPSAAETATPPPTSAPSCGHLGAARPTATPSSASAGFASPVPPATMPPPSRQAITAAALASAPPAVTANTVSPAAAVSGSDYGASVGARSASPRVEVPPSTLGDAHGEGGVEWEDGELPAEPGGGKKRRGPRGGRKGSGGAKKAKQQKGKGRGTEHGKQAAALVLDSDGVAELPAGGSAAGSAADGASAETEEFGLFAEIKRWDQEQRALRRQGGMRGEAGAGHRANKYRIEQKQALCRFYKLGRCKANADCSFSHEGLPVTRLLPCRYHSLGKCTKGLACTFSHEPATRMPCRMLLSSGYCTLRQSCPYSHDVLAPDDASALRTWFEDQDSVRQQGQTKRQVAAIAAAAATAICTGQTTACAGLLL